MPQTILFLVLGLVIIPCDKNVVLNKLPKLMPDQLEEQQNQIEIDRRWSATFLDFLQKSRTL